MGMSYFHRFLKNFPVNDPFSSEVPTFLSVFFFFFFFMCFADFLVVFPSFLATKQNKTKVTTEANTISLN